MPRTGNQVKLVTDRKKYVDEKKGNECLAFGLISCVIAGTLHLYIFPNGRPVSHKR